MRRVLGTPVGDYLPALGGLALTIWYLALAYRYKPFVREFPVGVAWIMVVLLGLDFASRTRTRAGDAVRRWLNPVSAPPETRPLRPQLAACLWVAGFAALMVLVGILGAVPIFMLAALRFRARRGLGRCLAAAAGVTLIIWLLFSVLLRLSLYPGLIFGGA